MATYNDKYLGDASSMVKRPDGTTPALDYLDKGQYVAYGSTPTNPTATNVYTNLPTTMGATAPLRDTFNAEASTNVARPDLGGIVNLARPPIPAQNQMARDAYANLARTSPASVSGAQRRAVQAADQQETAKVAQMEAEAQAKQYGIPPQILKAGSKAVAAYMTRMDTEGMRQDTKKIEMEAREKRDRLIAGDKTELQSERYRLEEMLRTGDNAQKAQTQVELAKLDLSQAQAEGKTPFTQDANGQRIPNPAYTQKVKDAIDKGAVTSSVDLYNQNQDMVEALGRRKNGLIAKMSEPMANKRVLSEEIRDIETRMSKAESFTPEDARALYERASKTPAYMTFAGQGFTKEIAEQKYNKAADMKKNKDRYNLTPAQEANLDLFISQYKRQLAEKSKNEQGG